MVENSSRKSSDLLCLCFLSQEGDQRKPSGNQQQHHRESYVYQQDDG